MMKKLAVAFLTAAVLSLAACGTFTCDICGQEKSGKSYKTSMLGEEVTMCKDCYDGIQELKNMFQ